MKRPCLFLLIIFFVLSSTKCDAQNNSSFSLSIKLNSLSLIAYPRPTLEGCIEAAYLRTGIEFSYGQQFYFVKGGAAANNVVNNFGNRYKFNLKYYFDKKYDGLFVGIAYWNIYESKNMVAEPYFTGAGFGNEIGRVEQINVYSVNFGAIEKFGKLNIEAVTGLGLRQKNVTVIDPDISNGDRNANYIQYLPHFNFGIKICYFILKSA